jgi:hypothetical protein
VPHRLVEFLPPTPGPPLFDRRRLKRFAFPLLLVFREDLKDGKTKPFCIGQGVAHAAGH